MDETLIPIADKVEAIADALTEAGLPYAFGGSIAAGYATPEPRGTASLDLHVFLHAARGGDVVTALPWDVSIIDERDQVRVWWERTSVDLVFVASRFQLDVARRRRTVDFGGRSIDVLDADDLAALWALSGRSRDWRDLAWLVDDDGFDLDVTIDRVRSVVGDDPRIPRLELLRWACL